MWSKLVLVLLLMNQLDLPVSGNTTSGTTSDTTSGTASGTESGTTPGTTSGTASEAASEAASGTTSKTSSAGNETETEKPAEGGNETATGDSKMCMMPVEMLKEEDKQAQVLGTFNKMRDELPLLKPQTKGACPLKKIAWDEKLMESAMKAAMTCPMHASGPKVVTYMNHQDVGGYGETVVFVMSNESALLTEDVTWMKPLMAMNDQDLDGVIASYKSGEWDPIFQLLWSGTTTVGCGMTTYNASDKDAMSAMFKMPDMVMPATLVNLVCHFSPAGPPAGEKPWEMCDGASAAPGEPGDSSVPGGEDNAQTSPESVSKDDVNPSTQSAEKSTAARVHAKIGFNFEAVAITAVLVLSVKSSTYLT